jgi:hypothetical protein
MDCNFGDEPSIRLTVFTIFELIYITWRALNSTDSFTKAREAFRRKLYNVYLVGKRPKNIRWYEH